ncbi:Nucleoporin GLE2 [Taenia crassiceps]|uniref:Nucleoporin GLE2 n=1 Tax=Taenia crassiceps TaxID=6207 RepID=A0ABR4QQH1_9CEST
MNENSVIALKAPGEKLPFSEGDTVANELLCVALSMDATRFVTGGSDTIIKVYDLTTRLRLLDLKSGRVSALAYHPRGKNDVLYSHIFVSGSWDQTIQIWDDRKVASLWHYYGPQVVGSDGIDIDAMQNLIVASSWVRSSVMLKMWKFADFSITGSSLAAKRKILQNYSKPVNEVALEGFESTTQGYVAQMGGEGRYIFYAGYGMNVLKVIDRESMNIVAGLTDLPNAVYSLDSCLDPRDKRRCLLVFTNAKNVYMASVQSRFNFTEAASA